MAAALSRALKLPGKMLFTDQTHDARFADEFLKSARLRFGDVVVLMLLHRLTCTQGVCMCCSFINIVITFYPCVCELINGPMSSRKL